MQITCMCTCECGIVFFFFFFSFVCFLISSDNSSIDPLHSRVHDTRLWKLTSRSMERDMRLISIYLHSLHEIHLRSRSLYLWNLRSTLFTIIVGALIHRSAQKRLFIALCIENSLYNKNASFSTNQPTLPRYEMFKFLFSPSHRLTPLAILKLYREMASNTHT